MAGSARKFLFDNRFDLPPEPEPEPMLETAVGEGGEVEPPPPPPPTFSEEDMNAAREEAFAQGHEQGMVTAMETIEARLADVLEILPPHFAEVVRRQNEANDTLVANGMQVAVAVMRKMFPALARRAGESEVVKVVEDSVRRLIEESKVVLRVHPDLVDPVSKQLQPIIARVGAEGKLVILGDAGIVLGDCRLEWDGGGAERDSERLWREIDEVIERNLAASEETPPAATSST